jgi:protease-4
MSFSAQDQHALGQLANAAQAFVTSEKRSRWFSNLLKLAVAIYLIVSISVMIGALDIKDLENGQKSHIAVVKVTGAIMPETATSAQSLLPLLEEAFENKQSKGIMLHLNSPGGSAVQSALIYDGILSLKKRFPDKPIYAVTEDMCASGCYYIAAASDKIYANRASIIGSIGVRFDSFGVTELMEKIGVENRSLAAGEHKRLLDPFSPADATAQAHLQQQVLLPTHELFKQAVREGRGERLKETPEVFTGLVWLGDEAMKMGLIDGLGEMRSLAKSAFNEDNLVEYAQPESLLDQLTSGIGSKIAVNLSQHLGLKF